MATETPPSELPVSTIPASENFAPELRQRAVGAFGEDGAWLLLSLVWYGWRTYYDLACGVYGGPRPEPASDARPVPVTSEYQVAIDLQIQAHVYAASEQFATLIYAMRRHDPGSAAFFEAYVNAPTNLGALIDGIGDITRAALVDLVGDPTSASRPKAETSALLDPDSVATVNVGGLEVPDAVLKDAAFDNMIEKADKMIDLVVTNVAELRQLVDPPQPLAGADRQPQPLRAVDNSFRHGLRLLFHEASPSVRRFRIGSLSEATEEPSVDLYLPGRGKNASAAINFATVSCTPDRTLGHLGALREITVRTGQLAKAFLGHQTAYGVALLLAAVHLSLPDPPSALSQ